MRCNSRPTPHRLIPTLPANTPSALRLPPPALIYADVARAIHNLAMPNQHEAAAVDARQEIDLRIGASFTRLQVRVCAGACETAHKSSAAAIATAFL